MPHWPPVQTVLAPLCVGQVLAQAPQLAVSEVRSISQPSTIELLQFSWPDWHVSVHW